MGAVVKTMVLVLVVVIARSFIEIALANAIIAKCHQVSVELAVLNLEIFAML